MTRSKFRKFWLTTLAIMMGVAMYCHGKYEDVKTEVDRANRNIDRLSIEKRSGSSLTAALAELDSRTMREDDATRLKVLEYLGLQQSKLKVTIGTQAERRVGRTSVVTREITITGQLPYEEALAQLDYFYNTKKISIISVDVMPVEREYGDLTNFNMKGIIYGLVKG